MNPILPLKFPSGTPVPLNITDWQFSYSQTFGNRPQKLLITESTIDELGISCERVISDATEFRYYDGLLLTRIKLLIATTDGVLENDTYITIQ